MRKDILLENRKLHDVNPLFCGEQRCFPSGYQPPIIRQHYLLHYVFSGTGIYHPPGGSYTVDEGQIFVCLPNELTTYTADAHNPWHYCWVGFESSLDLSGLLSSYVITAPEAQHIFAAISNSSHISTGKEWYICGKLYELFSVLNKRSIAVSNRAQHYVRMAQDYIQANYQDELRIDKLSESLNLDRSYFSKIFRKHTGKSPQRYIVDFRLDMAAELLARHGMTLNETAQHVGYGDIYNFSRMFHRRFGVSPGNYRNRSATFTATEHED